MEPSPLCMLDWGSAPKQSEAWQEPPRGEAPEDQDGVPLRYAVESLQHWLDLSA